MKKENTDDITSLSSLATTLRKRQKKGTLREKILKSFNGSTIWDPNGKKVVDDGKVIDEAWLEEKLAKIRGRGGTKKVDERRFT